ncbi:MAG: hypothetical protein E5Y58_31720 [Mesorhizobium sp.]|nr:MAG: hypothetical protein E5Y58_31720 [Mesorhizobium sp.]
MERIVAGAEPACRLSRRAESALAEIRDRLSFVDAYSLPVVSDCEGRITIWAFAGGAATASIAAGLAEQGLSVIGFNDLSISLRTGDLEQAAKALRKIDPVSVAFHLHVITELGGAQRVFQNGMTRLKTSFFSLSCFGRSSVCGTLQGDHFLDQG